MTEQNNIQPDIETMDIEVYDEYARMVSTVVPSKVVRDISLRLKPMLPKPKIDGVVVEWKPEEVVQVTEIALSRGLNPLSVGEQYHAWLDYRRKVCVLPHFANTVRWAQDMEVFRFFQEDLPRKDKGDFVCETTIVRQSYERYFQERHKTVLNALIGAGVNITEALAIADKEAAKIGVKVMAKVKYDEVYYDNGKLKDGSAGDVRGWKPGVSRARVRSLRAAIKQVYGTPTFADMVKMGLKSTANQLPQIISEMPDEVASLPQPLQQKWVDLDERRRENDESERLLQEMLGPEKYAEYSKRRQQKNTTMMRGEVLTDDWLDEKKEERKGPDWRDATDAVMVQEEEELVDYAKSMGAEVVDVGGSPDELFPPEPEKSDSDIGVAMSIGDVKSAMSPIYQTSVVQLEVIKKLYGDDASWEKLTQAQLWNIKQYTKRMIILHKQTDLTIEERLAKIPEVAEAEEVPETVVATKELLRGIVRSLGVAGKMKELA